MARGAPAGERQPAPGAHDWRSPRLLDADAQAAGAVVMQQLEAFRHDDFATAYTFASVNVRQMFDRAGFEQMVRGGYPEIAHSASATIDGSRRGDAGEIYLFIRVLGDNGRAIEAVYGWFPRAVAGASTAW